MCCKVRDVSSNIARLQLNVLRSGVGKFSNLHFCVQKDCAHVSASEKVVDIIRHLFERDNLPLILGVDGIELFIDAVQFLIGAL